MRIAICEDNELHRDMFTCMMNHYATERSLPFVLVPYADGGSFLDDIADGKCFDIVFLDIYIGDILGIDLARKLRATGYRGSIIFLTIAPDFALESYDVDADGYLLKPLSYKKLEAVLDGITSEVPPCTYPICQRSTVVNLPFHEILYIESQNTKCVVHTTVGEEYSVYKTLNTVERELNDRRFFRSHHSFLVNMVHVRQMDKQFLLRNGERIPIRQRGLKQAREAFLEYMAQENLPLQSDRQEAAAETGSTSAAPASAALRDGEAE